MQQGNHVGHQLSSLGPIPRRSQPKRVVRSNITPPRKGNRDQGGFLESISDPRGNGRANEGGDVWPGKPLKINTDLALYRSRQLRIDSQRAINPRDRKELLTKSEEGFRRVIQKDPTDGRAYVGLGKLLVRQRRFDEAKKVYEDGCAATEGSNAYIWTAWGVLESQYGTPPRARTYFDAAIVADKTHQASWHAWGMLEEKEGQYAKARDCWIKALENAEKVNRAPSEYIFCSLGMLAYRLKRIDEARKWFSRGTNTIRGMESYALWHGWGKMEADIGIPTVAPKLFGRALKINPRSRYTFLSWAMLEKREGNFDKARELLITANKLNKSEPALVQALAVLEGEMGNIEEARRLFKKGTMINPHHQHLWQAWGVLEHRQGCVEEARELFQQGIWAEPGHKDSAKIFQAWGVLEYLKGNTVAARELLKCGVQSDRQNIKVWETWILLEEELGYYQRADELRNLAVQQDQGFKIPKSFSTLSPSEASLRPFFSRVSEWFDEFQKRSTEGMFPSDPGAADNVFDGKV